jgi:lysophospholipase L1-like esterase
MSETTDGASDENSGQPGNGAELFACTEEYPILLTSEVGSPCSKQYPCIVAAWQTKGEIVMADNVVDIAARFGVEVGSRFPHLGIDYNPIIHKYTDEYISPRSYQVYIDAFPGGSITTFEDPEPEQRRPGDPGHGPPTHKVVTNQLSVGADTKFEFSITGRAPSNLPFGSGPQRKFSATLTKGLRSTSGGPGFFGQADPAWECIFAVPWPGDFDIVVTTRGQSGPGISKSLKLKIQDRLVVSIGDSAASGQGNPDTPGKPAGYEPDISWFDIVVSALVPGAVSYVLTREILDYAWEKLNQHVMTVARAADYSLEMNPKPVWLEPNAYRSLRSGPALAARLLEDPAAGDVVTFLPFGRSGSTIKNGLLARRSDLEDQWIGAVGQVEEIQRAIGKKRIDALLIQIGINDLDASGSLRNLLSSDLYRLELKDKRKETRDRVEKLAYDKMDDMPGNLDLLKEALKVLNIRHVYLTEYTTALFDTADGNVGEGCELFDEFHPLELSVADTRMLKGLAEELNRRLREQANRLGWFYISGIASAFSGHGYCTDDKHRYFVRAKESLASQGDTEGTIHPNSLGSQVIAAAIAAAVKRNTFTAVDQPEVGRAP